MLRPLGEAAGEVHRGVCREVFELITVEPEHEMFEEKQ